MDKKKKRICVIVNVCALLFLATSVLLLFTTYGSALRGVIQRQSYVESTELRDEITSNIKDLIDNILVVEFVWEGDNKHQYTDNVIGKLNKKDEKYSKEPIIEFVNTFGMAKSLTVEEMILIGKGELDIQLLHKYKLVDENLRCYINYINWIHGPIEVNKKVSLLSVMQLLGKMYRVYINAEQALAEGAIKPSNLMYYIEYEDSKYSNSDTYWTDARREAEKEQMKDDISLENIFREEIQYCYVFENTYLVELEMNSVYNAVRDYLGRPGMAKLHVVEDFLKKERILDEFGTIESYTYGQLEWKLVEFWRKAAIGIAFDTSLSVEDSFITFNEQYSICKKWALSLSIVVFISGIIWLVTLGSFLWDNRKKEITIENLKWIDRKTPELVWGCAIWLGIAVSLVMLVPIQYIWENHYSLVDVGNIFGYYKIDGFWIFFCVIFLLAILYVMLLRLIERIQIRKKIGIRFKDESYSFYIAKFIYEVYLHRGVTTKNVVELSIFCIANILNIIFVLGKGSWYVILFWINFIIINGILFKILLSRAMWQERITETIGLMTKGNVSAKVNIEDMKGEMLQLAEEVNYLGEGLEKAIQEAIVNERTKTELLTNVSHDIKTPLTSIVNYVDLLKGIHLEDERAQRYLNVLEEKSIRLKQLTEDMVEVAKTNAGNLVLDMVKLDIVEFLQQALGEVEDKFSERSLELVVSIPPQSYFIEADGNRLWRVIENLMNNAYKYSLPGTRVFVECECEEEDICISIKNISEYPLKKIGSDLTERFVRGDVSRSTEGSGLGLSIAKGFVERMGGTLEIKMDGDLFKVIICFKCI